MHEMYQAIRRLKSGKAPGPDGTTAELFKLLDDDTLELVRQSVNDIWYSETLPPERHQANLAVMQKRIHPRARKLQTSCPPQLEFQNPSDHYSDEAFRGNR